MRIKFKVSCLGIMTLLLFSNAWSQENFVSLENQINQALFSINSARVAAEGRVSFNRIELAEGARESTDLGIVLQLLKQNHLPIARMACQPVISFDQEKGCAKQILNGSAQQTKYRNINLQSSLKSMESLPLNHAAAADLELLKKFLKENLGESYRELMLGYHDGVDVFSLILISHDRSKLMVLSGTSSTSRE